MKRLAETVEEEEKSGIARRESRPIRHPFVSISFQLAPLAFPCRRQAHQTIDNGAMLGRVRRRRVAISFTTLETPFNSPNKHMYIDPSAATTTNPSPRTPSSSLAPPSLAQHPSASSWA